MRVVMTTDYFPPAGGGVEVVIAQVAPRLVKAGHDVMILTLSGLGDRGSGTYRGARVEQFGSIRLNRLIGLEYRLPVAARRGIREVITDFRPHVVNAHHAFFSTTPMALRVARDLGIPSMLTLHIGDLQAVGGWRGVLARTYESLVVGRVIGRADSVAAVSQAVAEAVPWKRVAVIPNGVDSEKFRPPDEKGPTSNRVLFVGRLIDNKGPMIMMRAFSDVATELPDVSLTMVGDGPLRRPLERLSAALGVSDRVTFLGMRSDVDELMRGCDLLVRPSLVEGMPLTVLEAMASGLPVIASDVAGVGEAVVDGSTGLLVRPGSVDDLSEALLRLMRDPELRVEMGERARRRAVDEFTWERTATETERLLEEVAIGV